MLMKLIISHIVSHLRVNKVFIDEINYIIDFILQILEIKNIKISISYDINKIR